jgi:hypothetical protein
MTMRYAHLSPEHGKAAIERLVTPAAIAAAASGGECKVVKTMAHVKRGNS